MAVKIIRNKAVYRQAGDLENKILHELSNADPNDCNCIVKKLRSFEFRGHLCLVFELLSLNLYQFLHKNNFVGLSMIKAQYVKALLLLKVNKKELAAEIMSEILPGVIQYKLSSKEVIIRQMLTGLGYQD